MWEPTRFLLFSTLETMSAFALMLAIFRIKVRKYIWPGLFMSLLINFQSYLMREEASMSALAPALSTILFILLITTVVKVPVMWSSIIAIVGTFSYTVVQTVILFSFFRGVDTSTLATSVEGAALQAATSVVAIGVTYFLLKFKIGFTADFEKFRFKWEHIGVAAFIVFSLMASTVMFYLDNMLLVIAHMALAVGLFLYYAIRKERDEY
ncbi:hypothetical protein HUB98_26590 [Paenibacillus barcinonensis]|uniref:Uncharacterized protein n=1 Tax=Paenibacillus barcinonensis TaxID=198119 RepID=A0A2V4VXI7_PAEBA|nr:hypothetical protein [Paenibacillus barcinonensis]PYE52475.1 hypothetical protein DFQ00_101413 [Paenibacillus barcinonensis]QKS59362.1 hypothetical protein HUB98_26260 [Paenibacillus barcinonensis]QKS59420.1 hypothetical protein HUB98_26590 [Paenibacillus barcinonensis]